MTIEAIRLTPAMPSRKFQVLDFMRRFRATHGGNPSLSTIAAACGTNKSRVQDAIRKLEHDGLVYRVPGKKCGTTALMDRDLVLRQLEADGYVINPPGVPLLDLDENGRLTITAQPDGEGVTNASLPQARARAQGDRHGKEAEAGREARQKRDGAHGGAGAHPSGLDAAASGARERRAGVAQGAGRNGGPVVAQECGYGRNA